MRNTSKVTVFLSSFNHGKYIRNSIDSILNQTYKDFVLIIYDDGSVDDSWEIINSYNDPRIKPYRSNVNSQLANNSAVPGVENSDYVAIHHSDDLWEPDKLELQVEYLDNHPEVGAVFSRALIIGEDGEPFTDSNHYYYNVFDQPNRSRYEWLNFFFNIGNVLCHPSVLIRNSCYDVCGKYNKSYFQLPDLDMWVRLCLEFDIYIFEKKLVRFRVRSDEKNTSGDRIDTMVRRQFEYLQILNHYRQINIQEEFLKIFPDSEKFQKPEGFDIKYALAMMALDEKTKNATKFFGLQLLFEIVNSDEHFKLVNSLYGFNLRDYFYLTGKYEIFSTTPQELVFILKKILKFRVVRWTIALVSKFIKVPASLNR